jgi:ElaB/YqjD/DUF883 family membrane-anchored ribosome-binding protein
MNPETQASLLTLEKELDRLRSAVEHIEQAKSVAQKVISAVGLIQKKYAEHLDEMLQVQKEAVREAGAVQQVRFDELGSAARRHILESAARAKKYIEDYNAEIVKAIEASAESAAGSMRDIAQMAGGIVQNTGTQLQGQLQDMLVRVREQLNALNDTAAKVIQESGASVGRRIEEIAGKASAAVQNIDARAARHIEDVGTLAKTSLQEVMLLARESVEDAGNQSKRVFAAIKKTQEQQSVEFQKVTVSADALIAASGKLVRTIDAIDFPARLQAIESDIRSLHYNLNTAMARLDALGKSNEQAMNAFSSDVVAKLGRLEMFTEKSIRTQGDEFIKRQKEQEQQLGTTRTLLIVVLVLNVLLAVGTYLILSRDEAPAPPAIEQVVPDTAAAPVAPVEEKRKR